MNQSTHFARHLRPRRLSDVIGQDLVVNMLQNGIFRAQYFPVYLFHGQRGCGKTTVGRIIAMMVNCVQLPTFQASPQSTPFPCLSCESCLTTQAGNHPDFIEIDAASHTGVDNIRSILESSSYQPISGRKKIYLIDEAHMLSRAAFNALLKMLEEPPATALFILATTEVEKVPVTVRSRSFQGVFAAPSYEILKEYLKKVARNHEILISDDALLLIMQHAHRCVRDALNLLEQLAAGNKEITLEVVSASLGMIDYQVCLDLVSSVVNKDTSRLYDLYDQHRLQEKNQVTLWNVLLEAFNNLTRVSVGAECTALFKPFEEQFKQLLNATTSHDVLYWRTALWEHEKVINNTNNKALLIQHVLSVLCADRIIKPIREERSQPSVVKERRPVQIEQPVMEEVFAASQPMAPSTESVIAPEPCVEEGLGNDLLVQYKSFLIELSRLSDKMPFGILKSGKPMLGDNLLTITLNPFNTFLEEQLKERESLWKPLLIKYISTFEQLKFSAAEPVRGEGLSSASQSRPNLTNVSQNMRSRVMPDPNDPEKWPKTHLIMQHFPGKIV